MGGFRFQSFSSKLAKEGFPKMTLMSIEQAGAFAGVSCGGVSVCDMVRLLGWSSWVTQWGDTGHWAAHSVRDSSGTEVDTLDTAMWLFVLLLAGTHHTTPSPVSYYSFELKITTTIK